MLGMLPQMQCAIPLWLGCKTPSFFFFFISVGSRSQTDGGCFCSHNRDAAQAVAWGGGSLVK